MTYVVGEFYWRVSVGETCLAEEYICPPKMLSREVTDKEASWSEAAYLEPEELRTAFKIAAPAPAQIEGALQRVLAGDLGRVLPARRSQPRHLRHFRIAPQVGFADAGANGDAGRTLLSLVCNDRPGLLADVTRVLREQRLRVHDARIATFGERAEDMFQISDEHDRPLHDDHQRQALRDALLAALDGDAR